MKKKMNKKPHSYKILHSFYSSFQEKGIFIFYRSLNFPLWKEAKISCGTKKENVYIKVMISCFVSLKYLNKEGDLY